MIIFDVKRGVLKEILYGEYRTLFDVAGMYFPTGIRYTLSGLVCTTNKRCQ